MKFKVALLAMVSDYDDIPAFNPSDNYPSVFASFEWELRAAPDLHLKDVVYLGKVPFVFCRREYPDFTLRSPVYFFWVDTRHDLSALGRTSGVSNVRSHRFDFQL